MTRPIGSLCSLLLVWILALGAALARQPLPASTAVRSAAVLALHDVAEIPLLATRVVPSRAASSRLAERDAPTRLSPVASLGEPFVRRTGPSTRITLDRQETSHSSRPRWRAYDAAAPPAPSRVTP